jgi:hypothetical protein
VHACPGLTQVPHDYRASVLEGRSRGDVVAHGALELTSLQQTSPLLHVLGPHGVRTGLQTGRPSTILHSVPAAHRTTAHDVASRFSRSDSEGKGLAKDVAASAATMRKRSTAIVEDLCDYDY